MGCLMEWAWPGADLRPLHCTPGLHLLGYRGFSPSTTTGCTVSPYAWSMGASVVAWAGGDIPADKGELQAREGRHSTSSLGS